MTVDNFVSSSRRSLSQDIQKLKQVWLELDSNSCPNYYNFHMHTIFSDGRLEPLQLIKQALDIGLKGFAITDHHNIDAYNIVQNWLEEQECSSPPDLWTGMEINADLQGVEVHILAYGFSPSYVGLFPYLQGVSVTGEMSLAQTVINTIHDAGGLAVLAHPARYNQPPEKLISASAQLGIDGVETFYAYGNPKPWQPSVKETELVLNLSKQYGLFNTCGTDTHGLTLTQRI